MAKSEDDGLFLLEVLIDKIVFVKSPCFSDKDFRTCVNIQCPAVEPLEICDDDPGSCVAKSGGPFVKTFNSGKSCLFSLKEADINKAMSSFPVQLTVYKSLPCGCLPTKIIMGEATIDMTKEFVQSRKKYLEDPTNVSYEALKDSFRIVGPDKSETGEVVMFLRISCFGKLIITRFQGTSGAPSLSGGGRAIVDRSCDPKRDYQTSQDPCVCGAAVAAAGSGPRPPCNAPCRPGSHVKGSGVCPPAGDPYNSMPCEDPDDPCYCAGPRPQKPQQMVCRNTHQYCLHVPKGALPRLPYCQDLKEDQIVDIVSTDKDLTLHSEAHIINLFKAGSAIPRSETTTTVNESLQSYSESFELSSIDSFQSKANSSCTIRSKRRSVSFSDKIDYVSKPAAYSYPQNNIQKNLFGKEEIVYMTLFNDYCRPRSSGTQATASVNKCLQVTNNQIDAADLPAIPLSTSSNWSSSNLPRVNYQENLKQFKLPEPLRYSDIYFFGRKKKDCKKYENVGMGPSGSKTTPHKPSRVCRPTGVQARCSSNTCGAQTRRGRVSIQDDKCGQSSLPSDMIATVSHIRIGPKEPCPIVAMAPCIGPNCLAATAAGTGEADQAAVKVSTVPNPRRGVFELVIRRLSGAPFAKNELMLEWTPPPCRPPPCGYPCQPCPLPICRPPKCRSIVCRTPVCRPLKCCRKPCRKPCGPPCVRPCGPPCRRPCRTSCYPACGLPCGFPPCPSPCNSPCRPPCRSPCDSVCGSPCDVPCRKCSRCRPACVVPSLLPKCRRCCKPAPCRSSCKTPPCKRSPCRSPCRSLKPCSPPPCKVPCCSTPCKSSPCLRPCPVGYKRPRRVRSQPKIRAHHKRISPCANRSRTCPIVRCRSGPCFRCCGTYPSCPPRRCSAIYICPSRKLCPIFPCSPRPYPWRSRCCRSSCLIRG